MDFLNPGGGTADEDTELSLADSANLSTGNARAPVVRIAFLIKLRRCIFMKFKINLIYLIYTLFITNEESSIINLANFLMNEVNNRSHELKANNHQSLSFWAERLRQAVLP
jgi:predicted tellurium resistance membrane protein TerC